MAADPGELRPQYRHRQRYDTDNIEGRYLWDAVADRAGQMGNASVEDAQDVFER